MKRAYATIVSLLAACLAAVAQGQSDTTLTYQGELRQNGTPAVGEFDFRFSLWTAADAGSQVGPTQTLDNHQVTEGRFSAELDFGPDAFDNSARWLQIVVEGQTLSPRTPISRSPYAIQTRGIYVDPGGRVGLGGTLTPEMLTIRDEDANILLLSQGNDFGPKLTMRNTASGTTTVHGNVVFDDGGQVAAIGYVKPFIGPDGLQFSGASDVHMKITDTGRVGIGTLDPLADLHLAGDAYFVASETGTVHYVENTSSSLTSVAITGESAGATGIRGHSTRTSGATYGVLRTADGTSGTGVRGVAGATTGATVGVEGRSESGSGIGVYALGFAGGGTNYGVWAESRSPQGRGIYAVNTATSGNTMGVLGQVNSPSGWAGYFSGPAGSWNYFQRNVGIGVVTPSYLLHLASNSAAKPTSDRWTVSSDARLKRDITPIRGALDDLLRLRGVTYRWRDPEAQGGMEGVYTGMIAQDVEKVFPEWIDEDADGYKTLTIIGFEGLAVEALRELREEKDAQINQLRAENDSLRDRLAAVERAVTMLAVARNEETTR